MLVDFGGRPSALSTMMASGPLPWGLVTASALLLGAGAIAKARRRHHGRLLLVFALLTVGVGLGLWVIASRLPIGAMAEALSDR
ncbi:MAG TPA: hypothetical protein DFS52_02220 [Myxococcales bacterium]|jgi:hypothetical protein|nr:hypothetical protein [Myxococcales bacterium]